MRGTELAPARLRRLVACMLQIVAAASAALAFACADAAESGDALTLRQVLSHALKVETLGELGRARNALEAAGGATQLAEGAFDWSARTSAGYNRIYQPGTFGGFLTTEVDRFNVLSSTVIAERQLANGIRVRPGYVVTRSPDNFRSDLARLGNRPLLQIDVPLDGAFGAPPDALRLQAAQTDQAAARTDVDAARQSYLHRVVTAVWLHVAARERVAVHRELAQQLDDLAARVTRLARAGEAASLSADELRARAALARASADRDAADLIATRLQLASLIRVEPDRFSGVAAEFPTDTRSQDGQRQRLGTYVEDALQRRPDVRSQVERIEAARIRGRIGEREVDSQFTLTLGHDRLLLNYFTPLGENRRMGARRQAIAALGAAEDGLEDAKHRIRLETQLALERLIGSKTTIERAGAAVDIARERLTLIDPLVYEGRQPASTLADVAEQLASAKRQSIDARLQYVIALADLRRAVGSIPDGAADPGEVANLFLTEP